MRQEGHVATAGGDRQFNTRPAPAAPAAEPVASNAPQCRTQQTLEELSAVCGLPLLHRHCIQVISELQYLFERRDDQLPVLCNSSASSTLRQILKQGIFVMKVREADFVRLVN